MRLARRINLALLAVGVLPVVMIVAFFLLFLRDSVREISRAPLRALASQVAKEVDRVLHDGQSSLDFLKRLPALRQNADMEELRDALRDTLNLHPLLQDIYVLEPTGQVRASAKYSFRGEWKQNTWFLKALQGQKVISDIHASLYPLGVIMTMAQPIRSRSEAVTGVLLAQLDLAPFQAVMNSVFNRQGQALVIDHRGYVVATSGPEQILAEFPIAEINHMVQTRATAILDLVVGGTKQTAAVHPLPGHPWSVVLIRPQSVLYATLSDMHHSLYAILGLTLCALAALGFLFSRHLSSRLERLFEAAHALRGENFTIALDNLGTDEIGDLGRALTQSARELQDSRRVLLEHQYNLEKMVQERSMHLRLANANLQQEVTERALAQKALAEKQTELENLFNTAPIGIAICQDFCLRRPNIHLLLLTGYPMSDLDGLPLAQLMASEEQYQDLKSAMTTTPTTRAVINLESASSLETEWKRRDGGKVQVLLRFAPSGGEWILTVLDISQRKAMEEQLRHMALHDPLTSLGNRALCQDRLEQALARQRRNPEHAFALLFVDMDRFKVINDSQGHAVGDELLRLIAGRLQVAVRETDTVCRYGGDEFLIILDGLESAGNAIAISRRLHEAIKQPFLIEDREYQLSASLGLYLGESGDNNAEQIIQRGNIAMHWAKESGRNCFKVFTKRLMNRAVDLLNMENDLRQALGLREFFLEYQPIMHGDNRIFGFEALVRWQHPVRGRVAPDKFIPVAEEVGIIHPLGEWILQEACAAITRLNRELNAELVMSVNISGRQLGQTNFAAKVENTIRQTGVATGHLKLELTETALMKHLAQPMETLGKLRQLGITLSVDDFGTGYSSLAYIQSLALNYLKISRSFVSHILDSAESLAIVQAIRQLGHTLGMGVIAEGVETPAHLAHLQAMGCDLYQGYHFARPLPEDKALNFARAALELARTEPGQNTNGHLGANQRT
ncbi:MAG: EAL domain-containing protein [Deltaproteobacteria bacterium]|nr:EAL domain-containing protein [Deltaproteobacteria bacterium]